jgi:putative tryptophan/tyrosine transport system substrate-binding protein
MQRREFITLVGGAAAAWPLAAHAQPAIPVIGFLSTRSAKDTARLVVAFEKGLQESGFSDGKNLTVDYRFADGQLDRLPELAADLVRRSVAVLVTAGGGPSAIAAKAVTTSIPIVFVIGSDPVKLGLVASLSRPGGNATGITIISANLAPKRLGLLHELVPDAKLFAGLINPDTPEGQAQLSDMDSSAQALGLNFRLFKATNIKEIENVFATLARDKADALLVGSDPIFDVNREKIVALVATAAIPAIYQFRDYTTAGGLMSYDPDIQDAYRQIGSYAGKILKGALPADLPIQQPTKFHFVINLKTAKTLNLEIPPNLLARADEVIE